MNWYPARGMVMYFPAVILTGDPSPFINVADQYVVRRELTWTQRSSPDTKRLGIKPLSCSVSQVRCFFRCGKKKHDKYKKEIN